MKFLGLRLCAHDSNLAYADGSKVRFFKSERHNQIKHHGYGNLLEWVFVLNRWNVSIQDLDGIAIVIDAEHYPNMPEPNHMALAEQYLINSEPFQQLKCPVYRVDHHYAHKLSVWPLGVENSDVDFVFDGFGDDRRSHTIFRGDNLESCATLDEAESIGRAMSGVGKWAGMTGNSTDFAGKLMGLKSHGKIDPQFLAQLEGITIFDIKELFKFRNWGQYIGDKKEGADHVGRLARNSTPSLRTHIPGLFPGACHSRGCSYLLRGHRTKLFHQRKAEKGTAESAYPTSLPG